MALNRNRDCGLCRKVGHMTAECPKRKPTQICQLCASLTWRVVGPRCRNPDCRLRYKDEPPVELDVTSRRAVA